jgi:hypothetical protein
MDMDTHRRPEGQADEEAASAQPLDSITVLRSLGRPLTKRFRYNKPTGTYSEEPYGNASIFSISEVPLSGFWSFAECLEATSSDQQCAPVRGKPADGVNRRRARRRLHPRKNKATGEIEPATLEQVDRHWTLLDVDGIPCPENIDPIHEPDAASTIPSFFPMIFQYVSRSSKMRLQNFVLTPPVKSDSFTRAKVIQARACLMPKRLPSISK